MQGFADQRLAPVFERGVTASPKEDGRSATHVAPAVPARAQSVGKTLRAVSQMLDGIGGLGWSVTGFLAGAVFWHFVGFWGFVSEVVLAGGPPVERAAVHSVPTTVRTKRVQVAATAADTPCTLVSRDRQTGLTSARPCGRDHLPLPQDSYQGRQDRIDTTGRDGWVPLKTVGTHGP